MTDTWIQTFNTDLRESLSSIESPCARLKDAMIYATCGVGKRVRARLCYLIGSALSLPNQVTNTMAQAIECLHAFTLVHDDLPGLDNDPIRRGQPSCHAAFDEATAILAGDALQAYAFELLTRLDLPSTQIVEIIRFFSDIVGANGLCSGQSLDMQSHMQSSDQNSIEQIHHLKTGRLMACCTTLPAIAANTNPSDRESLEYIGQSIGLLFQIKDDLIDNNLNTGKSAGKDACAKKATFGNLKHDDLPNLIESYASKIDTHLSKLEIISTAFQCEIKMQYKKWIGISLD